MGKSRSRAKYRRAKIRHALFTMAPDKLLGGRLLRNHLKDDVVVRRFPVTAPLWRSCFDGMRIGHVSDLHMGDLMPMERVDEINRLLVPERLDLLAFTGDAVDLDWKGIEHFFQGMVSVPARYGHYLVLGNHDHLDDPEAVVAAAREAGITVLIDEHVAFPTTGGEDFRIAGVDWTKRPQDCSDRIAKLCDSEPGIPFDLLLSHNPKGFNEASVRGIPLTLSGHTHGGQVAVKGRPGRNLAVAHRLSAGFYEREGSVLFVTTGVGSWFPLRIQCPPEVVVMEVRGGDWEEPVEIGPVPD